MNQTDALYYAHKVVTQHCGSIAPFKIGAASQHSVVVVAALLVTKSPTPALSMRLFIRF